MTNVWTEVEVVKVVLQIVTILVGGIGLGIAIRQLRLVYFTYRDLHDWNRRKAALDAADKAAAELGADTPLLQEKFQILSTHDEIPLEKVQIECDADPKVRTALQRRLNFLESVAIGVYEGVLDESVTKRVFIQIFRRTVAQFKNYMNHRRRTGSIDVWIELERLSLDWEKEEKDHPERQKTGVFAYQANRRKSKR